MVKYQLKKREYTLVKQTIQFTREQWDFLATFEALESTVSIDIIGILSPLPPSSLISFIQNAIELDLLQAHQDNNYQLCTKLPEEVEEEIARINTSERYMYLIDKINNLGLKENISLYSYNGLLVKAGKKSAGEHNILHAYKLIKQNLFDEALEHFVQGLADLKSNTDDTILNSLYLESVLQFSDLCISLGKKLEKTTELLEYAHYLAEKKKDKRSMALISFHRGRIYYLASNYVKSFEQMEAGKQLVDELGDNDIQIRSAGFLGLYYYMQGLFSTAMEYFERSYRNSSYSEDDLRVDIYTPIFYGYCAVNLGQFHKAVGTLDAAWRHARRKKNAIFASTIQAVLGTVLLLINKQQEGETHLQNAWKEAINHDNAIGIHIAKGGIAYKYYLEGNMAEAHRVLSKDNHSETAVIINKHFSVPWILEIIFEFYRLGYLEIPGVDYKADVEESVNLFSLHMRGVLWRLLIQNFPEDNKEMDELGKAIMQDPLYVELPAPKTKSRIKKIRIQSLLLSEKCLELSGDPIQLAKTRIELARFQLDEGQKQEAIRLAQKAREGFSGLFEDSFPDELRFLLKEKNKAIVEESHQQNYIDRLIQMTHEFTLFLQVDNFFDQFLTSMNRFFGAERGAVFWQDEQKNSNLSFRAGRNLNQDEVNADWFHPQLAKVYESIKTQQPILIHSKNASKKLKKYGVFALLCIPLKHQGKVKGVLYHDNSYLDSSFKFLTEEGLQQMTVHLNRMIDRMIQIDDLIGKVKALALDGSSQLKDDSNSIISESDIMSEVLSRTDKIAQSESSVLIQGKTGVGKELLAERIHRMSPRYKKPFIIIDPTTIPDNLLESELFGHEKGSFTGAIKQKIGRVELADNGSLFIDEIGEISKSVQAKLLRVLQEKTFTRIGGNQMLNSDFRLIAATNRDLAHEVKQGRFREDLFYRLNVVPILIPCLFERGSDIVLLANHFLQKYAKKYHLTKIKFSPEEEKLLLDYHWPGNVRELKSIIERAVILSVDGKLELNLQSATLAIEAHPFSDTPTFEEIQKRYFQFILNKCDGRMSGAGGASELSGINRSTLYSRLKKLNIHDRIR